MIPADVLAALRVLVDPGRIRLLALLATRPMSADALADEVRRPLPAVGRDLDALRVVGLVEPRSSPAGVVYAARPDRLGAIAAALAALERQAAGHGDAPRGGAWPHDGEPLEATEERVGLDADDRRVLRSYLVDGRLTAIPARGRKRAVVLRFLRERVFTEARAYPEREVNQRLALFHPDVAALRRYLVDDGLVTRADGLYRRAGEPPGVMPTVADGDAEA
jgi:hypothetical protein